MGLPHARTEQPVNLNVLQGSLDKIQKDIVVKASARRLRAFEEHKKSTHFQQPNFSVGDLVLVRRRAKTTHKLQSNLCVPGRIIATPSPLVYIVELLGTRVTERVHFDRQIEYAAVQDGQVVPDSIVKLANRTEAKYEVLDAIVDISEND